MTEDRRTAIHESGHVAGAIALGEPFDLVEVRHIPGQQRGALIHRIESAANLAIVIACGPAAETLVYGSCPAWDRHRPSDWPQFVDLCIDLADAEVDRLWPGADVHRDTHHANIVASLKARFVTEAQSIVRASIHNVERLADELLWRPSITQREVTQLWK